MNWLPVIFALNLSLLLLHEMDAIRTKEWNMFIILKDMSERTAYLVFSIGHLPLYFVVIYAVSQTRGSSFAIIWLIVDLFLIAHAIVHFFFRKHAAYGFHSLYSNILIFGMAALGLIHLLLML